MSNIKLELRILNSEFVTIPELLTIKDRELHQEDLVKQHSKNQ
ncbi:hypothetical protein [Okeania sp. SIO3I5]|nr:hypothetical protein [Okeania sp. SIO3I5]